MQRVFAQFKHPLMLLIFSADLAPQVHHNQGVIFHHGAFAQNATLATKGMQSPEDRPQVQIGFLHPQVLSFTLRSISNAGEVNM